MYNTNTRTNNTNSKQGTGSPRYRESGRGGYQSASGGRGRDSQKKQNVWAPRNAPANNPTPESDFMSKFGLENAEQKKEPVEAVTQQINNLSVQDNKQERTDQSKQNNSRTPKPKEEEKQQSTNGAHETEESSEDRKQKIPREKKSPPVIENTGEDEETAEMRARKAHGMKLSLAEFHNSVNYSPTEAETPSRVLWVGNIGNDVTEEELEQEFGIYGKIESLRILHNRYCAFVNFENEESAKQAKKQLHHTVIGSQHIVIHYRKPEQAKPESAPGTPDSAFQLNLASRALWIGNIANEVTEDELLNEFQKYGTIESIRVLRNKTCAFVNFMTVEEAANALQALQGKKLGNMAIKINFGKPQSALPKSMTPDMGQYGIPQMQSGYISEYPQYIQPGMPPFGMFPPYFPIMEPYQMGYEQMGYEQLYDPAMYMHNMASMCELCMTTFKEAAFNPCGHASCNQCLGKLRSTAADKPTKCPWCGQVIQKVTPLALQLVGVPYPPAPVAYGMPSPPPTGY